MKDTKLAICSAKRLASTSVFANVRELIARRRLAQITEHANVFAGCIIASPELVIQLYQVPWDLSHPRMALKSSSWPWPSSRSSLVSADGTLEQLQPLNMRADEVCRFLQMLRFSLICHRERLGVIHEGSKGVKQEIVDKGKVAAVKMPREYAFLDCQRASGTRYLSVSV